MSTLSPLETVKGFLKDMEALDYGAPARWMSADCDYLNPPPLPPVRGPEAVRGLLEPFFAPVEENVFQVLREAENGGQVLIERLDRHRLGDRWVELPVTGLFQVEGGKITYWRDYFDAATILSQWPASAGGAA